MDYDDKRLEREAKQKLDENGFHLIYIGIEAMLIVIVFSKKDGKCGLYRAEKKIPRLEEGFSGGPYNVYGLQEMDDMAMNFLDCVLQDPYKFKK